MKHSVVVLPTAENDLNRILLWLSERSHSGALAWLLKWEEVVLALADDPDRCGLAPESDQHPIAIRQVIFRTRKGNPYRALFTIKNEMVFVLHVRGMGQKSVESVVLPSDE
jgi:plasmid stabilization system protein ParE